MLISKAQTSTKVWGFAPDTNKGNTMWPYNEEELKFINTGKLPTKEGYGG